MTNLILGNLITDRINVLMINKYIIWIKLYFFDRFILYLFKYFIVPTYNL